MSKLERFFKDYKWSVLHPNLLELIISMYGSLLTCAKKLGYEDYEVFITDLEEFDNKYEDKYII